MAQILGYTHQKGLFSLTSSDSGYTECVGGVTNLTCYFFVEY